MKIRKHGFSVIGCDRNTYRKQYSQRYWSDLKRNQQGSQLYENIVQLKIEAADGKKYATDCLDTPNLLRPDSIHSFT